MTKPTVIFFACFVLLPRVVHAAGSPQANLPVTSGSSSPAANRLYWNPSSANHAAAPEPAWNARDAQWNTAADRTGKQVSWLPGSIAVFSGTDNLVVCVEGSLSVGGIESSASRVDIAGSGRLVLAPEGLKVSTNREIVLSAILEGPGALTVSGTGTLSLAAPGMFSGGVFLEGGTLRLLTGDCLGSGTLTVSQDATLEVGTANLRIANPMQIASRARLTLQTKNPDTVLTSTLAGEGDFRKTGIGTLTVAGPVALHGKVILDAGQLIFASPSSSNITALASGGLLRFLKGSLASGSSLTIGKGGALAASGAFDGLNEWVTSGVITAGSDGVLALDGEQEITAPLDLTTLARKYPSLSLGSCGEVIISGPLTFPGKTLRLGGGGGDLEIQSSIAGDAAVIIGSIGASGEVKLSGEDSFSGGLTVLGGILRVGNAKAVPAGDIAMGTVQSNEENCTLDLNNFTLPNAIHLLGRATVKNSGGRTAVLSGSILAGNNYLRLAADNGSALTVSGSVVSSSLVIVASDKEAPSGGANLVELSPSSQNSCTRIEIHRRVVLRAHDGTGLPANAHLVLNGGVFESSGTLTRELVADSRDLDGKGAISLIWNHYGGSGFSAHGGEFRVQLAGARGLVWGSNGNGTSEAGNYKLVLNAPTADSRLVFDTPLDLAGNQLDRMRLPTPLHQIEVDAAEAVLPRAIVNSASSEAGIEKLGLGTLSLGGADRYDGPTQLGQGTLFLQSPAAVGGTGRTITPSEGTILAAGYPIDNAFLKRLTSPNATPFTVALGCASSQPLDFNSEAGCILRDATLGATTEALYSGTLTPCGAVVRLGGGGGKLSISNASIIPNIVGETGTAGTVALPPGVTLPRDFVLSSGNLTIGGQEWSPAPRAETSSSKDASSMWAPVLQVSSMDRWVDASWSYPSDPAGGFVAEISRDGRTFQASEKAWPNERRIPIFVGDLPESVPQDGVKISVRVAAVDSHGARGPWSIVEVTKLQGKRDIAREIALRFPGTGDQRRYNATDPERLITFSETQKSAQRRAASAMIAQLTSVAENQKGPRHFTIPPGIYRIEANQIRLRDIENFSIHAPDVEIIVDSEKNGSAFVFDGCKDLILTGQPDPSTAAAHPPTNAFISFDAEHLNLSVGRIVAVNPDETTLDLEMLPGYDMSVPDSERMMAYRPDGSLANVQQMGWSKVQPLGGRMLRLTSASLRYPLNQNTVLKPGNLLVMHNSDDRHQRGVNVYSANGCANMTYESIHVFSGSGSPSDFWTAGHTIYRDWRLTPRNGTSRLEITAGLGQFSKDGGSFVFENCEWGPHLDDGINLNSTMAIAARQDSSRSVVIGGLKEPKPGATLTFYDYYTWKKLGEAEVTAVAKINEPETTVAVQDFSRINGNVPQSVSVWRATLDRDVTLQPFAMVVYSNYRADEIVVRGCLFRDQLAQIMLIQGAKSGLIENNVCLRSAGPAISMQFSQYWWEGPMPGNIIVRNNIIRDNPVWAPVSGFDGSGSICAWPGTTRPVTERLLSGFRIEGNTITNSAAFGILLRNVDHAVIRYNTIINPGSRKLEEEYDGVPMWKTFAGIGLTNVSDAQVTDNDFVLSSPWCKRAVDIADSCDKSSIEAARNNEITAGTRISAH
jgi:autotransporter-associated beta strand protein